MSFRSKLTELELNTLQLHPLAHLSQVILRTRMFVSTNPGNL